MEFDCKIDGVKYAGLELADVQIGLPSVKTQQESVPGADGVIDLTDVLNGGPAYGNRTIKLRFGFDPYGNFDFYAFAGAVHGKRLKLELGNRSGYYIGRFTIGDIEKARRQQCLMSQLTPTHTDWNRPRQASPFRAWQEHLTQ